MSQNLITPLQADELRIGNYVRCVASGRILRVIAISPDILQSEPLKNYLVDTIDYNINQLCFKWPIIRLGAVIITPELLVRMGWEEHPYTKYPTHLEHVYLWPSDASSFWIIAFDEEQVCLWMVLDDEERCVANPVSLHHLQNLMLDLDGVRLRLDNDQDTITREVIENQILKYDTDWNNGVSH